MSEMQEGKLALSVRKAGVWKNKFFFGPDMVRSTPNLDKKMELQPDGNYISRESWVSHEIAETKADEIMRLVRSICYVAGIPPDTMVKYLGAVFFPE